MGLESAIFIQDLDASNPLAGDKKNQGDDHLRLIKAVLRTTLPNASRALYIPKTVAQAVDRVLTAADDNLTLWCSTGLNITLPATAPDGWQCEVVKANGTASPVFVLPSSGTINGFARIRCDVPFHSTKFQCLGNTFFKTYPISDAGELKPFPASTPPVGYAFAAGQSLLRADFPELFGAWGGTWGVVDGAHFNAPDPRDRFMVAAGLSYALGAVGGEVVHTLSGAEMPSHQHGGTTGPRNAAHTHTPTTASPLVGNFNGVNHDINYAGGALSLSFTNLGTETADHGHDFVTSFVGGGTAHENRPPYLGMNYMFRLC